MTPKCSSSGLPSPRGMLSLSLASNRRAASAAIDQVVLAAPAPVAAAGFVDSWLAKVSPQVGCEMIPPTASKWRIRSEARKVRYLSERRALLNTATSWSASWASSTRRRSRGEREAASREAWRPAKIGARRPSQVTRSAAQASVDKPARWQACLQQMQIGSRRLS